MDKTPTSIIRDEIRSIAPYYVPDSRGLIKLDAMENPYGLPAVIRRKEAKDILSFKADAKTKSVDLGEVVVPLR